MKFLWLSILKHFLFFWLLVVTGVVLYIVLDTSVGGAYQSINDLTQVPWMLGVMLRGVHRYAAEDFGLDPVDLRTRFAPYVDLYQRACAQLEKPVRPIGVHSPGFVAETDEIAQEKLWPHYAEMFGRIGRERGWPPVTKDRYLAEVQHGALYVGAPETVARKIAKTVKTLGIQRFDMKYSTGPVPHADLMECIRLYGEKVIPMVQDMLADRAA